MQRLNGFTLAELLVVIAITSLGLTLAVPGLLVLRDNWGAQETLHTLTLSLARARLAAVVGGHPVTVCPSADGLGCRTDLVWDEGWIVFTDPLRMGQPSSDADILWAEGRPSARTQVRSSPGRHRIRFQPTGFAGGNNASLKICSRRKAELFGSVVVNLAGRARISRENPALRPPCPFAP